MRPFPESLARSFVLVTVWCFACAAPRAYHVTTPGPLSRSLKVDLTASGPHMVYLEDASREVLALMFSDEFKDDLSPFLPRKLATSADATCRVVTVADVLGELKRNLPPLQLSSESAMLHWLENAHTDKACGHIDVRTSQIDKWMRDDERSELVNTVAHEITHVLGEDGCADGATSRETQLYTDQGLVSCANGTLLTCSEPFLVSYVWGDLVACAYTVRGLDGKDRKDRFESCVMSHTYQGGDKGRTEYLFASTAVSEECKNIRPWSNP